MRIGENHRLSVLLFTDIVDSVQLQARLGTKGYAQVLERHDQLFRDALEVTSGRILKHTGDGFLAEFAMSSEAVAAALRFQRLLHEESWEPEPILVRVGLHQGEVLVVDPGSANEAAPLAVGMAVNLAARVMDLASGAQILITRPVYENARYYLKDHLEDAGMTRSIRWVSHGAYEFKGRDDPMDILEVGFDGISPFAAPEGGGKSRRLGLTSSSAAGASPAQTPDLSEVDDSDVFISYACLDNQPLAEGEPGWVTRLHDTLSIRLGQLLGRRPRVWRDPKADQEDAWHDGLDERLESVRTLVPIISPPYLQTTACQRELHSYGERTSDSRRLIQVVKTPAEEDDFSSETRTLLERTPRIEFFELDGTGHYQHFDASLGEDLRRRFLHGVYDLAYEISQRVKSGTDSPKNLPEKTVFLAETTHDLRDARDRIKRELQERGFRVLPERPLPLVAGDLQQRVASEIEQADAVVHLIGQRYGVVPEDSERSLVELQCELSAAELEKGREFTRFFWAPSVLDFEDRRQESFFHSLEHGDFGMRQTEFVRGSLEELKRLTLASLNEARERQADATEEAHKTDASVRMVYLICDPKDHEAVEPLEDHLYDLGYEVKVPPNDGDAKLRAEMHRQILTMCDGVLIYFGQGSHQWVEMTLMDIMKAPAYGRSDPLDAQAVYIAPPFNRRKERFRTHSAVVMRNGDTSFSPDALEPFLNQLGPARLERHA